MSPRIRSIKPEFWGDEKLAPLDVGTRLVFIGLISMADDAGRLLDSVKQIDAMLFPMTDDSSREALATLSRIGRIERGKTASGQSVIQIVNWRHQKVDHPNLAAALPPIVQRVTEDSRDPREAFATDSRDIREPLATLSTIYDLRSTTNDQPARAKRAVTPKQDDLGLVIDRPSDEQVVLDHYLVTHPRRRIGPKDRKAVAKALTLGYSAGELCEAIDGNAQDEWHREKRKHELPYVLRDTGKIDDFRARVERPAASDEPLVDEFGCLTAYGEQVTRP